jgi:hypothetical protein
MGCHMDREEEGFVNSPVPNTGCSSQQKQTFLKTLFNIREAI